MPLLFRMNLATLADQQVSKKTNGLLQVLADQHVTKKHLLITAMSAEYGSHVFAGQASHHAMSILT